MREFILSVLQDLHGISPESFDKLKELASYASDYGLNIDDIVDSAKQLPDGRYVLPLDN